MASHPLLAFLPPLGSDRTITQFEHFLSDTILQNLARDSDSDLATDVRDADPTTDARDSGPTTSPHATGRTIGAGSENTYSESDPNSEFLRRFNEFKKIVSSESDFVFDYSNTHFSQPPQVQPQVLWADVPASPKGILPTNRGDTACRQCDSELD